MEAFLVLVILVLIFLGFVCVGLMGFAFGYTEGQQNPAKTFKQYMTEDQDDRKNGI